ncbi:MAG: hypothetical protein N2447_05975, partial [Thermoanaerobaculum sp.]|nr:hypothetical protein [Thermoanaerobaculum sp.]
TWHRLHLLARSPHFPEGWREELEVEVVGSTILAATRRLIPDSDPMGVVFGRAAELRRVRWLVYAALAMGLGGLFVTLVEAFYVHQRLPWRRGFLLGSSGWGLGLAVGHSSLLSLFWAVAAFLSFLTVQGLGSLAARLDGRSVLLGVLVGAWSLLWPEVVVGLGGWVPSTGLVLTEPWPKVVGESGFRALAQELLLRGAIPFLLQPFLGMPATVLLAATAGGLLDPRPAVPLPLGLLGELAGQTLLGLWAARHGWLSALLARFFAELVRLGYHAPQFPWQEVWPALTLLALGGFLWAGKKP